MNKLEEYKIKQAFPDDWVNLNHEQKIEGAGFERGFDDAIALDLPVKFGIFIGQKCQYVNNSYYSYLGKTYTTQQLYQYWIDNIFKIE